jgi:hypothetical protein
MLFFLSWLKPVSSSSHTYELSLVSTAYNVFVMADSTANPCVLANAVTTLVEGVTTLRYSPTVSAIGSQWGGMSDSDVTLHFDLPDFCRSEQD